ncbi:hypothetical protein N7456_011653 [Penicillium angulare]|uniref:AB hydrolase-1 domain-containing protein n=1 Tax=Penicillium angulare TaxID=116970 RepID=A0A9W9K0W4_9EURO|nr:hypothetical protein N7456_011653 [Penicillium angulare]
MARSTRIDPLEEDFPFKIISHLITVPPFREYPHAIIDEKKGVYLSVKQYIPRQDIEYPSSNADPITIIANAGLGFIKEIYEPLFAEIYHRAKEAKLRIKSIWIADMFNLGESAIANLDNLGCDATWLDHSRDMWSMINHFRDEMPKPIFGLGHSVGAVQLACLSSWHPTLFHSLVFVEPGLDASYGKHIMFPVIFRTLQRKESWTTRKEAEMKAVKAQGAETWADGARERLKRHGVFQHHASWGSDWALTTPKNQIASMVLRHNPEEIGMGPGGLDEVTLEQRALVPDINPDSIHKGPFYRPELELGWSLLPGMRPWVLYVNGGNSHDLGPAKVRDERARITGTGVGGSGGMKLGAVKQVVIEGGEHTLPFDHDLSKLADHLGDWFVKESKRWEDGPKRRRAQWNNKAIEVKQAVTKEYFTDLTSEIKKQKRAGKL